jgi:hypothetical protein
VRSVLLRPWCAVYVYVCVCVGLWGGGVCVSVALALALAHLALLNGSDMSPNADRCVTDT